MTDHVNHRFGRALISVSLLIGGEAAQAQTIDGASSSNQSPAAAPAAPGDGDITVTAQKRDETSLAVRVVVTAVSAATLQRMAINNLDGIARIVPQLIIAPQGSSAQEFVRSEQV